MTYDSSLAEDLTQDIFVQAYKKLATYRGEASFSTWLHRVAVNTILMFLRAKKPADLSLDAVQASAGDEPPAYEISRRDLALAGAVDRVTLERAIESLAPGYRLSLVLHDIEGYDHYELSEMLCFSVGCSKSQLHKARLRLRMLLRERSRTGTKHGDSCDAS
jgi:RNA polymerase sigma-70 factor (ECF subfamily)